VLVKFTAKRVSLDESFHCTVVTFDTTRREYLMFQRADPEVADEESGLPPPPDKGEYLERRGQACAAWGGVEACELSRTGVRVRLSEATARQLRGASEFDIAFKVGEAKFARLRRLMRQVFRGEAAYREADAEPGAAPDRGGTSDSVTRSTPRRRGR
jgi:hypothetical protein